MVGDGYNPEIKQVKIVKSDVRSKVNPNRRADFTNYDICYTAFYNVVSEDMDGDILYYGIKLNNGKIVYVESKDVELFN